MPLSSKSSDSIHHHTQNIRILLKKEHKLPAIYKPNTIVFIISYVSLQFGNTSNDTHAKENSRSAFSCFAAALVFYLQ